MPPNYNLGTEAFTQNSETKLLISLLCSEEYQRYTQRDRVCYVLAEEEDVWAAQRNCWL